MEIIGVTVCKSTVQVNIENVKIISSMIDPDSLLKENRAPSKPFQVIIWEDKYYVVLFHFSYNGFRLPSLWVVLLVIITECDHR